MNTWQCWRHLLVPVSLPCGRISHLQLVDQNFVPQIDHFVTILPYYGLCKMSKNGNSLPPFKILFLKNIWIYLRLTLNRYAEIGVYSVWWSTQAFILRIFTARIVKIKCMIEGVYGMSKVLLQNNPLQICNFAIISASGRRWRGLSR